MLLRAPLLALLAVPTACDTTSPPTCQTVEGTVAGFSEPVFEGDALIGFRVVDAAVDGALAGTAAAEFVISAVGDDGTLHLAGSHVFRDPSRAVRFRTDDEGLTTADGRVENRMALVEGATGRIDTEGAVDLETGALALAYEGEVCR